MSACSCPGAVNVNTSRASSTDRGGVVTDHSADESGVAVDAAAAAADAVDDA